MSFEPKPRAFTSPILSVEVGAGERKMTLGGASVQPPCFFDKPGQPAPLIGVEVSDVPFETEGLPELAAFYEGADTLAARAVRAASMPGASFVCLRL
ncbi:MAG: acetyl-CoA synthase subunit delta, partial [Oscillospiraceae bacterium]|nr:acetyl-CoA synthase subunit delta [Oscillospiraceae bacterium]